MTSLYQSSMKRRSQTLLGRLWRLFRPKLVQTICCYTQTTYDETVSLLWRTDVKAHKSLISSRMVNSTSVACSLPWIFTSLHPLTYNLYVSLFSFSGDGDDSSDLMAVELDYEQHAFLREMDSPTAALRTPSPRRTLLSSENLPPKRYVSFPVLQVMAALHCAYHIPAEITSHILLWYPSAIVSPILMKLPRQEKQQTLQDLCMIRN